MRPDSPKNPDLFQQAWKKQTSQTRVTVDTELLLKEVQRSLSEFRTTVFWRDFREIFTAFLMLPLWLYMGITMSLPWTWYLVVPALMWVAGFMLVYRKRQKRENSESDSSLLHCLRSSLDEQEDQIWLLRNIFWWYLLPFVIALLPFSCQIAWSVRSDSWVLAFVILLFFIALLCGSYFFVYWINQRAVSKDLEPRRQELLALLASLREDLGNEG